MSDTRVTRRPRTRTAQRLAAASAAACALVAGGVLLWRGRGKTGPFKDAAGRPLAGSLAGKVFVDIDYTLAERAAIWRGKAFSRGVMWDDFQATDLTAKVTDVDLPVYICQGRYDYTCGYDLARGYFEKLRAPVKGFYTFARSAHSPAFEEPERFRRVLREDVLTGEIRLADGA